MNRLKTFFILILISLCAVLAAQSSDSTSYHGKRVGTNQTPFEIVFISTENGIIQLGFSIPVNPQSLKPENILLNKKPLSKDTAIKFNKTGKVVEIEASLPSGVESVLQINEVRSFDDQTLETSELNELVPGATKEYSLR